MTQAKTLLLTTLAPLALLAAPAVAATFVPPEGCKTFVTIQSRGCTVSHFYSCEKDAPGERWRADFGADGPVFLSKTDAQTQWLESYEINPPTREVLEPGPRDPASYDELMSTGLDTFDFRLSRSDGRQSTVKGYDRLLGETRVIDGLTLQRTEFEYTQTDDSDGSVIVHSRGNEFIAENWRSFLSDHAEFQQEDGSWFPFDGTPVKFYYPGQAGFQSTVPLFDCDAQAASLKLGGN